MKRILGAFLIVFATFSAFAGLTPANAQCGTQMPGGTLCGNRTGSLGLSGPLINPILGVPGASQGQLGLAGSAGGTATIVPQTSAGTPTLTLPNVSGTFAVGASSPLALNTTSGLMTITGLAGGVLAGSGPAFTLTPVLGVPGTSQGTLGLAGASGGTATITAQATAGSPTITLPNASGTVADGASSPLVLSSTTGNLTCPTCVTSSGGGSITGTAPINVTAPGVVSLQGATGTVATGSGGTGSLFTATPTLGVAGTTQGTLSFAGSGSGTATIQPQATAGTPILTLPNTSGTFADGASSPLVLSTTTGNLTCPTCVTSSGGGAITGTAPIVVSAAGVVSLITPLALNFGGTNNSLTASAGGIVWSDASKLNILAGTATANQMLQSGASATPAWSTNTWPATNAQGDLLYGSAANVLSTLAKNTTATRYLANTGTSNNPNWDQVNLANGVTSNLPTTNLNSGTSASATTFWNGGNGTTGQWLTALTSVTPGGGLVSSITANCSQTAITTTGTLSRGDCVNPQTGTTYTIADSDRGKIITGSNAAAQAYSIARASTASAFFSGWTTFIQNNSVNAAAIITITPTTSQICAQGTCASTYQIQPGQFARITSDGTNYQVTENPIAYQLPAPQTNVTVNAGNLNEIKTQTIAVGSAVSLSNGTPANIATITLTAGNWLIWAAPSMTGGATTTVTGVRASISTTSGAENTANPNYVASSYSGTTLFVTFDWSTPITPIPVSLSGSQQYWLVERCNFAVSTCSGYGTLTAQRTD